MVDAEPVPASPPLADGPIGRLIRSFSSPRSATIIPEQTLETPSSTPAETEPTPELAKSPKPKAPTPLERFWKHARRSRTEDEFPPSRWFDVDSRSPEANDVTVYKEETSVNAPISEEPQASTSSGVPLITEELDGEEDPTPQTLARRIQLMLSATTPVFTPPPGPSPSVDFNSDLPPQSPISALSPLASDSKMLSFLSSPKVMNGSLSKGQQSVWSILERLQSPVALPAPALKGDEPESALSPSTSAAGIDYDDDDYDYDSSVMLCSPLIPQRDDLVELAETEYVSFNEAGKVIATQHYRSPLYQVHTVSDLAPHDLQDPDETEAGTAEEPNQGTESVEQEPEEPEPTGFQWPWSKKPVAKPVQKKKPKEKRIWVPSTTKISLQTTWWGYRM
jgi:hypothetical protein